MLLANQLIQVMIAHQCSFLIHSLLRCSLFFIACVVYYGVTQKQVATFKLNVFVSKTTETLIDSSKKVTLLLVE